MSEKQHSVAIIAGSGLYQLEGYSLTPQEISTPFGDTTVLVGEGESEGLFFLPRHGVNHTLPPHRVKYRANIMALYQAGVKRIIALYTVGSIREDLAPGSLLCLDNFIDFTRSRSGTFFDGDEFGLAHVDLSKPYCPQLSDILVDTATRRGVQMDTHGTIAAYEGPRLETPAEIQMCASLGCDVVGMTAVPESQLARELSICFAGCAISVNFASGMEENIEIDHSGLNSKRQDLVSVFVEALRTDYLDRCRCGECLSVTHRPTTWKL